MKRSHSQVEISKKTNPAVFVVVDDVRYAFEDGFLVGRNKSTSVEVMTFYPDGESDKSEAVCLTERVATLYSGHVNGHIYRWVPSVFEEGVGFCEFYTKAHTGSVLYFAILDELLYSYGEDSTICIWDQFMTCTKIVRNVKKPMSQYKFEKLLQSHNFTNEIELCDFCHDQYNLRKQYCCQRCPTHFDLCQRCSNFLSGTRCPPGYGCGGYPPLTPLGASPVKSFKEDSSFVLKK